MKNKPKSHVKSEPKNRNPCLRRTDEEMIKFVKEIESGLISWPNQIDHAKPELNPCCFVLAVW